MINCTGSIRKGIYNCFGDYDESMCYECRHNSLSKAEIKTNKYKSQRDRENELYEYLRGIGLPKGVRIGLPKLSAKKAFEVIWFLQEVIHVLPDHIEQCRVCKELFDAESEGYILSEEFNIITRRDKKTLPEKYWGKYCDNCVPDIEFEVK